VIASKAFALLKRHNSLSLRSLVVLLNTDIPTLTAALKPYVDQGYIKEKDGYLYLPIVLTEKKPFRPGLWQYETLIDKIQAAPLQFPARYLDKATIDCIVHRCQGPSPTCVGQATVECADLLYLYETQDVLTAEDWAKCQKNVLWDKNDPKGPYYDVYLRTSHSSACAYHGARKVGNVVRPGAFIDDAALFWQKEGLCRDWQWIMIKDGVTQLRTPYPDKDPITGETVEETKPKHRLSGFAEIKTDRGIKQAVMDRGACLIAYSVSDNYLNWKDGTLRWKGADIGGHAGVIVGWDDDERFWWILQSWRDAGFPKLMKMPYDYWNKAKIGAIALLDYMTAQWAREAVYRHLSVILAGVPAETPITIQIADKETGGYASGVGADLLIGETYEIRAQPKGANHWVHGLFKIDAGTTAITLTWDGQYEIPEKPTDPGPGNSSSALQDQIREKVNKALEGLKKLFSAIFKNR